VDGGDDRSRRRGKSEDRVMDDGSELAKELAWLRRRRERAHVPADAEVRAFGAQQHAPHPVVDQADGVPQLDRCLHVKGVRLPGTVERDRQQPAAALGADSRGLAGLTHLEGLLADAAQPDTLRPGCHSAIIGVTNRNKLNW
jgi:hypothetical protein